MSEETFKGVANYSIYMRSWHPSAKARGVVAIVHGFNAHGEVVMRDIESWIDARLPTN